MEHNWLCGMSVVLHSSDGPCYVCTVFPMHPHCKIHLPSDIRGFNSHLDSQQAE